MRERIVSLFERHGWSLAGEVGLLEGADFNLLLFRHPDCAEPVQLTSLAPNGETVSMFAENASDPDRVFYVYDGVPGGTPPHDVYVRSKVGTFLHQLGLRGDPPMLLGVVEPGTCPIRGAVSWSQL